MAGEAVEGVDAHAGEDGAAIDDAGVVKQPWTTESGLLTPTLKIKREAIEARYLPHAEAWLASGKRVIWED